MAFLKQALIGGATAFAVCGAASAADLGVKKPSPVEYVKVCNTYGAGFFYIPGGNTCIKVGGRVRAEVYLFEPKHAGYNAGNDIGFRSQGHIQFDARTATEYGTLRTFVRLLLISRTGGALSGSQQRYGTSTVATGADFNGQTQTNIDFLAFVQFAGFTVGRTTSFFDYYTYDLNWQGTAGNGINTIGGGQNLFAYTATLGQGFSATLSIEDQIERRQLILNGRNNLVAAGNLPNTTRGSFYGGAQTPDIIGNVRWEQGWGSAQVSAALHEVTLSRIANAAGAYTGAGGNTLSGDNATIDPQGAAVGRDYGYAVQGGVKINLPFLAAGDLLVLQGAYGKGAAAYTDGGGQNGTGSAGSGVLDPYNFNTLVDGYAYSDATGRARVSLSDSYTVFGGIRHYWLPTLRSSIFAGYTNISYGRAASPIVAATSGVAGVGSITQYDTWQVGTQLVWSPVKDLDIGGEVQYNHNSNNNRGANYVGGFLPVGVTRDSDAVIGRIRMQRDF